MSPVRPLDELPADHCGLCHRAPCAPDCPTRAPPCVCGAEHDCRADGCDPDCAACCGEEPHDELGELRRAALSRGQP